MEPEVLRNEPDVLPVFYYNDALLSNIGDTIGSLAEHSDYRCRPGDVGFVVQITGLWPQARGSTFGVQGSAVSLAAVSCTWVEPNTHGLHYAQYLKLDAKKASLLHTESEALVEAMLESGWDYAPEKVCERHLRRAEVGADVFFSSNWPDRTYVMAFLGGPDAERELMDCWSAALPALVQPRFTGLSFRDQAVHRFSALDQGVRLDEVMEELRQAIVADPEAMEQLKGKESAADPLGLPKNLWPRWLGDLRLARLFRMPVNFQKRVNLEPELVKFGYREQWAGEGRPKTSVGVLVTNESNVELWTRTQERVLSVAAALIALYNVCNSWSFVPGPLRKHAPVAAASAAGMMMAPAAFADEIGDAAKKLGDASYDFAKEVDWNNGIFLQAPGKFQPLKALKAIDKMIDMGAAADPKLLKAAAEAHHKAIGSISGPNGVTSRADWDAVNAALGRVVASVPKAKVMDVYNAVKDITDPGVPAYMKSLVNGADAEKAYKGFLEFKDVVEKSIGVTAVGAPATVPTGDKIGVAAKALSDASYPFLKEVDWLSDVYLKPLPDTTAPKVMKAIDKMIVMGSQMDGNLLKAAAEAHHKAIGSVDAKGVTSAADYEAVNAAIGRIVASVPKATVMDVYNSMAAVVDGSVPNNMFSKVNPLDAVAAAKGFYTFKDVVEASQR
ncbi:Peridinin-chlorophyll a-binding protein [Durusdinium trenchii]|uniref:Chloroplastic (PCP) n=1 Tax=Durusdinium trenchii TaxID=1381693 RepID=A0ABP0LM29_9DINO